MAKQWNPPQGKDAPVSDRRESLARELFARMVQTHTGRFETKATARIAIEAAEAFYEIWDESQPTNGATA